MVDRLVWDIGGVLLRWDPEGVPSDWWDSRKEGNGVDETRDGAVVVALKQLCRSPEWAMRDAGRVSAADAARSFCERYNSGGEPSSTTSEAVLDVAVAEDFLNTFDEAMVPLEKGVALLERSAAMLHKREGHMKTGKPTVLVLSNFHREAFQRVRARHAFFDACCDGFTISASVGHNKPDRAIYEALCEDHGIIDDDMRHRTLFIDDRLDNVEGARAAGLQAFHCTEFDELERELAGLGLLQG
jgi:FMN phosphatase YigB (HAD superfamily)